ncbi:MAG TPA: WYL domain-containing protein, partial [Flavobacterium sp.]|nr:WYL domain-containing protein [Flavobacterium sp.]
GLRPVKIELWIDAINAPYVLTKPLHHTQKLIQENEDKSIVVDLCVAPNYELERLLLGFGCGMEVLKPESLRNRIKKILQQALDKYENEAGGQPVDLQNILLK